MIAEKDYGLQCPWPVGPMKTAELTAAFKDAEPDDVLWVGGLPTWKEGLTIDVECITRCTEDSMSLSFDALSRSLLVSHSDGIPALAVGLLRPLTLVRSPEYFGLIDLAAQRCCIEPAARRAALAPVRAQFERLWRACSNAFYPGVGTLDARRRIVLQSMVARAAVIDRLYFVGVLPTSKEWEAILLGEGPEDHAEVGAAFYEILKPGPVKGASLARAASALRESPLSWSASSFTEHPHRLRRILAAQPKVRAHHRIWVTDACNGVLNGRALAMDLSGY